MRPRRERGCNATKKRRLDGINAILAKLPPPVPVRDLCLFDNVEIGDAGMAHIHLLPASVKVLNLGHCNLTHKGIKLLCEHLKTNESISELLIFGNSIGEEGAKHLASMFRVNKTIRTLFLGRTHLGPEGFAFLTEGLALNDTLKTLLLHCDESIRDAHIRNLFQGLKANQGVTALCLGGMTLTHVTSDGMRSIVECLRVNHYLTSIFGDHRSPFHKEGPVDDPAWPEVHYLLVLNARNRKIVADENATLSDWLDCVIDCSGEEDVGYSFFFLRSKPELCMHSQPAKYNLRSRKITF